MSRYRRSARRRPRLGSLPAPAVVSQEPEGEQAALARAVPGFGGLFLDESGAPTVYLTDPGQRLSAQRALVGIASQHGFDASALQVRKGEFTWRQLEGWFGPASKGALAERGVVYADLDEASNRVTIGVENADAGGRARAALRRLGVPDRAVLVRESRPIEVVATLQDRVRPVGGGLQINFGDFACTLGFNAIRSGVASYITNSHCTNVQGGTEGTKHYQQDRFHPNTQIGTEVADPVYFTGGACPATRRCRFSDSSRGKYLAGVSETLGRIVRTTVTRQPHRLAHDQHDPPVVHDQQRAGQLPGGPDGQQDRPDDRMDLRQGDRHLRDDQGERVEYHPALSELRGRRGGSGRQRIAGIQLVGDRQHRAAGGDPVGRLGQQPVRVQPHVRHRKGARRADDVLAPELPRRGGRRYSSNRTTFPTDGTPARLTRNSMYGPGGADLPFSGTVTVRLCPSAAT